MVQRQGKANVRHVKDVKSCTLTKQITNYVEPHARLFTDEYVGYNQVSSMYNHAIVYHSQGEFANGEATTNTIESFWAIVKRGVMGIYHFWSRKHLQLYLDEFTFRYNTRLGSDGWRFNYILANATVRTRYEELIHG